MIARAAETDDTALVRAQLDAVLPIFADGLRLDRDVLEQWADFDARIGLVEGAARRGARVRRSTCALKRGAPEPCHGPGCLRSRWWPLAARLQSREWRVRGLAAVTYVLRVRRINHLLPCSIAQKS